MKKKKQEIDSDFVQEIAFVVDTTCNVCYAEFLDAEDLEVHIRQMHGISNATCQLCTKTYTDLLSYADHIMDSHLTELKSCRYCAKTFSDTKELRFHERKHVVNKSYYSCTQCDAMYITTRALGFHEQKMHNNDIDGLYLLCLPYLSSILCLNAAKLLQMGHKLYECLACRFKATDLKIYNKHLNDTKCRVYVCGRCFEVCKDRKNVRRHIQCAKKCISVDDIEDQDVICEECDQAVQPKHIKEHLNCCKKFKCVDCSVVCQTIDELSEHQLREHPLDMDIIRCKFCQKEFIGNTPLRKHVIRVHKPMFHLYKYKCVDCGAIFKHPQKMFAHFFTQHKELQPFHCRICNKKFRVRKAFSLHIKLDHKSVGFVEFDEQYHVFFTANKSKTPFIPSCVIPVEDLCESDSDSEPQKKKSVSIRSKSFIDMDATDAETEDDKKRPVKKPIKRKLPRKQVKVKRLKKTKSKPVDVSSSDEEPLMELKKRSHANPKRMWSWKKKNQSYTCDICKIYCYTYQNHKNHMSLHNSDRKIECVKCSRKFDTKDDLSSHMENDHASSKLTETLKNILQKKKQEIKSINEPVTKKPHEEKFTITMQKVNFKKSDVTARITQIENDLSVKNFLENFTPESIEAPKRIIVESAVTMKCYNSPFLRESIIKLNRFRDDRTNEPVSLKMPQRYKDDNIITAKVSIKLAEMPVTSYDYALPDYADHNYSDGDHNKDDIPEVAHEVQLEDTQETPKQFEQSTIQNIVLPKLPEGYSKLHIATLQPQAPYFKIIKVEADSGYLKLEPEKVTEPINNKGDTQRDVINLPDGTKLVTVNPLAHLLGDRPVENLFEPVRNKYYKSRITDFQGVIAKAMQKLEEGPTYKKKKRAPKHSEQENQAIEIEQQNQVNDTHEGK